MGSIQILKYSASYKQDWNNFARQAKNTSFLFQREFMEYHADRFEDFSLMFYENNKLIALLPAHKTDGQLSSHFGLTYGGLLIYKKLKFDKILSVFTALLKYAHANKIDEIVLKLLPDIYHTYPAEEIDYLLFLCHAECIKTELSSAVDLKDPIKIQSNRMEGVKKAQKNGLEIKQETEFDSFWKKILIPNLAETHGALPVHSIEEISLLQQRFPKNILQYNVYYRDEIVGGCTLFITEKVVHTQYISANQNRQQLGTLDFLFHHLITERFKDKSYFDFGTSNENQGKNINRGLLYWKECFGGRGIRYATYKINTRSYNLLEEVML